MRSHRPFGIILLLAVPLLMVACQSVALPTLTAETFPITATQLPAVTPTLTASPTSLATQSPTKVSTLTPTLIPKAIPTMRLVGTFGAGWFSRVFRSPDGKRIFALMNGNELRWYNAKTLQPEGVVVMEYQFGSTEVIFGSDPNLVAVVGYSVFLINLNQKTSTSIRLNADVVSGETHFSAVQFSPDAKLLFFHRMTYYGAGFGESIDSWDIQKNQQADSDAYSYSYWQPDTSKSMLTDPTISQNGKWIASGYDKLLQIRDIQTGEILRSIEGHDSKITHIAFSKDGSRLVSVDKDGVMYLWDSQTGQNLSKFSFKDNQSVKQLTFLDNERVLATFESGDGRVIDLQTGQVQAQPAPVPVIDPFVMRLHNQGYSQFYGYQGFGISAVFSISPDGKTLAVGSETVLLWDIQTRKLVGVLEHPDNSRLSKIQFDPTGHMLIGIGREILIWNLTETAQPNLAKTLGRVIKNWGQSFSFSADGKRIAFGNGGTLEIWDIETTQKVKDLRVIADDSLPILANRFSADGQLIYVATSSSRIKIWDIEKGQLIQSIEIPSENAWETLILDDLFVALHNGVSTGQMHWIEVWNLERQTFKNLDVGPYTSSVFNKSKDLLFTNDDIGTIRAGGRFYIWQVDIAQRVYTSEADADIFYYDLGLLEKSNFVATHGFVEGIVELFDISAIIEVVRQP